MFGYRFSSSIIVRLVISDIGGHLLALGVASLGRPPRYTCTRDCCFYVIKFGVRLAGARPAQVSSTLVNTSGLAVE